MSFSWQGIKTLKEIIYSKTAKTALAHMLETIRPDIAHAHNIYGRLTTSVLDLLNDAGIPVVLTLHDYKLICPSYKLMHHGKICEDCKPGRYRMAVVNRCHKDSYMASAAYAAESYFNKWRNKYQKNVRFFISPSRFLRDKLIEFGYPGESVRHIPNFVAPPALEPEYVPGKYFLYFGRLSGEKGVGSLLRAFLELPGPELKLKIVGDGPLRTELQALAGTDPRVSFEGYLSGKRLHDAIRGARAVVVPSEWYENAPLSILEAMALGKPILGARIGGIPEMIEEGENGSLFGSGNTADLKDKLQSLQDCPESEITRMGRASRERVERDFTAERHMERLLALYQEVLEG